MNANTIPLDEYERADRVGVATVRANSLAGLSVPPRQWHVDELVPAHTVTLLGGDGGTGKSLLALQLAVATVTQGYWVGREVKQGRVVYFSAEDDIDELHRRLFDIAAAGSTSIAALKDLVLVPVAGKDALLALPDGKGNILKPTPLYGQLDKLIDDETPVLFILDTLADVFGGEENQRAQARQFIGLLRGLCLRHKTTALLLAHPSLSGMSTGSGSSGSTGWNNSVRSRLYLDRLKGDGDADIDPDVRVLTTKKANYGKTGLEIKLRWVNGAFSASAASDQGFTALATQSRADRIFLELVAAYEDEGRSVTATTGHGYAPALFAKDSRSERLGKHALVAAMNRLFASGHLQNVEYGPPSRRTRKIVRTGKGTGDDA